MTLRILTVSIAYENDVVAARQRARQIADLLGFESQDQTRIATAISEVARNVLVYAGGGKLEFTLEGSTAPQVLLATISDQGPGIENVEEILAGSYQSQTGMGLGILGARRLMDGFQIQSVPGHGTTIRLRKILPHRTPMLSGEDLRKVAKALASPPDGKPGRSLRNCSTRTGNSSTLWMNSAPARRNCRNSTSNSPTPTEASSPCTRNSMKKPTTSGALTNSRANFSPT
jgi:anti-sigma regulatory factor (Ser/Thr protein kinase)